MEFGNAVVQSEPAQRGITSFGVGVGRGQGIRIAQDVIGIGEPGPGERIVGVGIDGLLKEPMLSRRERVSQRFQQ